MHLYAQNGLQKPWRVENVSSIHFRYRKKLNLTNYCGSCIGDEVCVCGGGGGYWFKSF